MDQQPSQDAQGASVVDQPSDMELVARANVGDAGAFEAIYLRYRDWVVLLAQRFTGGDRELALDVMQETFMHLLRRFPGFVLTAQLKTYLYPVVRHTALAMVRKQRREMSPRDLDMVETTAEASQGDGASDLTSLRSALNALDAGQREVLILRFADDLSLQEIASAMSIPLGTVKSRLHHALATLRANDRLREFFLPL